ncbi:MAG: protein kinase [Symploca sp. SIO2E6]|nr:protein kinase [Symploca sp. SIO2E6]
MSITKKKKGTVLNKCYEIISDIGGGGQGITYLVQDKRSSSSTLYVIKQLKQDNEVFVKRFDQEAKILKYFTDKNVLQIPVYKDDFDQDKDRYLVQEFIQGSTLKDLIKSRKRLNKFQVIALLQDVLDILSHIHDHSIDNKKIYHRDIKPSNLMWQDNKGHIVIIDFGISKYQHLTDTGYEPPGTPGYAPPELLKGNVYPSSDIYSLGVTAIEALTGNIPEKDSTLEGEHKKLAGDDLAVILNKMIRSKIEERYESAQQVIKALQSLNSVNNKLNNRYQIIKAIDYLNQENCDALIINYTYTAIDERDKQEVIIQEFDPRSDSTNPLRLAPKTFAEECKKLDDINNLHTSIPLLLDHFTESSKFYLVYDFIQGRYLSQDIVLNKKTGRFWGEQRVIKLIKKLLITLDVLHTSNYLHLDINPSRILIKEQSEFYLTGSLKIEKIDNLSSNSYRNIPLGTRDYISPEQKRGYYSPNGNLYSLGMIAIQLLTGKEPQQIKSDKEHKNLWDKKIKVQTGLKKVLEKMVDEEFRQGHRYQSASEVINDLEQLKKHGKPSSFIDKTKNLSVLWKILGGFSLVTLFTISVFFILVLVPYWQARFKYNEADTWLKKAEEEPLAKLKRGYYELALEGFNAVLKNKPDFFQALTSKSYVIGKLDDDSDDERLFLCKTALLHEPKFVEAYNCLGELYKKSGKKKSDPEEARKDFDKAIEQYNNAILFDDPSKYRFNRGITEPLALYNLGEVYIELKQREKSVEKKLEYCKEAKKAFERALPLRFKSQLSEQDIRDEIEKLEDEIKELENESI